MAKVEDEAWPVPEISRDPAHESRLGSQKVRGP